MPAIIRDGELSNEMNEAAKNKFSYETGHSCLLEPTLKPEVLVSYRKSLGMSQKEFAEEFDIPLGTLRRWEQGQNRPYLTGNVVKLLSNLLRREETTS